MGIRREFICRYTPEQNDVTERKNRSVVEAARAMKIQNQIGEEVSAHELYFGRMPNLLHLRIFRSIAYVHLPDEKRRKLEPKSEKWVLVGYSYEQKGYKCYNPQTKQVRVSRDVAFDESAP